MGQKLSGCITLTLTPEEAKVVEAMAVGLIVRIEDEIAAAEKYPDSETFANFARGALKMLPVAKDIFRRVNGLSSRWGREHQEEDPQ